MYKRIISVSLAVILLLTCGVMLVTAAQPTLSVSSAVANPGDVVELEVVLENNPGINTFSLGFDYDKSKLDLLDVTINENLGGQFVYREKAVWLNSKDTKYNGEILKLEFKVLDSAKSGDAEVNVTYSPGDISNYDEQDVNFKTLSGKITVENGETNVSFVQMILSFFNRIIEKIKDLFAF